MRRSAATSAVILALLGCCTTPGSAETVAAGAPVAQAASATFLDDLALRQAVVGKTLASKSHRGIPYTMVLKPDGTGVFVFSGTAADPLTWDITGNVLCFHSKLSSTECNRVRASGGGYDFVSSTTGALNNTYTVQ